MIETLIFDMEGVVIDSEGLWDRAQEILLKRRNLIYEKDKIKVLLTGKSLQEGISIIKDFYHLKESVDTLLVERNILFKDWIKKINFIKGFLDFFYKMKRYKKCVATSMNKELLEVIDQALELTKLFEGNIFSIADVEYVSKPSPDLFIYAANMMGSRPINCLVFEDSPYGIQAAKRAGMKCVALTSTYKREMLDQADIIVDSFSQINSVVELTSV